MVEMHFDIHSRGKRLRDKNLIKMHFTKRSLLASGLRTIFLSEKPNEICNRLRLINQDKKLETKQNRFDSGTIALVEKLLEYKCHTPTHHKKKSFKSLVL